MGLKNIVTQRKIEKQNIKMYVKIKQRASIQLIITHWNILKWNSDLVTFLAKQNPLTFIK